MWRFSATASGSGGAAFVVLYVLLTFAIGIPLLMSELAIGRKTGLSPISALKAGGGKAWAPLGYLFVAAGFLILICVPALLVLTLLLAQLRRKRSIKQLPLRAVK